MSGTQSPALPASEIDALKQQLDQFFASAENDSTLMNAYIADPVATLGNNGVQLPQIPGFLQPMFLQSLQGASTPLGSTVKRNALYGEQNSVACWSCEVGLNVLIWGAIAAAGIVVAVGATAAIAGTDGIAAPAVIAAIVRGTGLAADMVATIALRYGATAALSAAGGAGGAVAGIAVSINRMVDALCNAIPNCCSSGAVPQSDGLWHNIQMSDETSVRPSVALVGSNVLLAYKDSDNGDLWSILYNPSQGANGTFTNRINRNNCWTLSGTSMTNFNNNVFCAYLGGSNELKITSTSDGVNWSTDKNPETVIGSNLTTVGVSLCSFNGKLFCAFKANDNTLQTITSSDATNWDTQPNVIAGATTSCEPALAVFQNKLFCVYRGVADNALRFASTADGVQWSSVGWMPDHLTAVAPALTVFNGFLYCFYIRAANSQLAYSRTQDGILWLPEEVCASLSALTGPAVAASANQMFAAFRGSGTSHITWAYTTPL